MESIIAMSRKSLGLLLVGVLGGSVADARPAAPQPRTITVQDRENYFQGNYIAYASPWSIFVDKTLVHGKDYLDTITVTPATFPDGTVIRSLWPIDRPMKTGVWGYHAVSFGKYESGIPKEPVPSRRVNDLKRLTQTFKYSYSYSPNFNLLNEFYLTSKAGDHKAKLLEIGFFLHTPRWNFVQLMRKQRIVTYTDAYRRRWVILKQGTFVMIVPEDGRDVLQGAINVRQFLNVLIRYKVITGREWFNGIAFGTEPIKGAGRTELRIERWRVDYK